MFRVPINPLRYWDKDPRTGHRIDNYADLVTFTSKSVNQIIQLTSEYRYLRMSDAIWLWERKLDKLYHSSEQFRTIFRVWSDSHYADMGLQEFIDKCGIIIITDQSAQTVEAHSTTA